MLKYRKRQSGNTLRMVHQQTNSLYWGWFVVMGAFLSLFLTYGARYSFGVFVRPMADEYHWSMSLISLSASINIFTYATASIYCGRIVDQIAPKFMMFLGYVLTAMGYFSLLYIVNPLVLYISYGIICGVGTACTGQVVCSATVGKWFDKKQGLAMGIATMGIGIGTMTLNPVAGYIVIDKSWREGFLFLGALTLLTGITIALVLMGRNAPGCNGLEPLNAPFSSGSSSFKLDNTSPPFMPLKSVLLNSNFWIIVTSFALSVLTVMMTFVHQVAYATIQNIGKYDAAGALGIVGISGSLGKFFFGWLCDRMKDAKGAAATGFLIMALGMFVLMEAKTKSSLYSYAIIYGFGYGALSPVMPYLISNRFGRHMLGSVFGILTFFVMGIGGSIGPVLGGIIYDLEESYTTAWAINIIILLIASLMIMALRPMEKSK